MSPWETVNAQSSHLRTVLQLCADSKTTHLIMAVSSVLDGGSKRARDVCHCYALVWADRWHIINIDGTVNVISFYRHSQPIPEILGATVIRLYNFTATHLSGRVDSFPQCKHQISDE